MYLTCATAGAAVRTCRSCCDPPREALASREAGEGASVAARAVLPRFWWECTWDCGQHCGLAAAVYIWGAVSGSCCVHLGRSEP